MTFSQPNNQNETVSNDKLIGLTGASGYIGNRMLGALQQTGYPIRCLSRNPEYLQHRMNDKTEAVQGDAQNVDDLIIGLRGIHTAFYFIHSMSSAGDFEAIDRRAAQNFAEAAKQNQVKRIIYLGGLGDETQELSPHLKSRHEVGEILRSSGVPVIELRASIVIGSGSTSYEMVRALVERLPVMITPKWVSVKAQPIAVHDLTAYLLAAIALDVPGSEIIEIGGNDITSYEEIMNEYARQRGLTRFMIKVPVLTPHLSSLWLGLITPLYARIGKHLISSIKNPTIVTSDKAKAFFSIQPVGIQEAIERAIKNEDQDVAASRWSDSLSANGYEPKNETLEYSSRVFDKRDIFISVKPHVAFAPIQRIGGKNGWYYATFLWRLRGYLDLLFGGIGIRRGRRDQNHLFVGDTLDWWRVEAFEQDKLLRLRAEMKVPGRAWLQYEVEPYQDGSIIHQTAIFDPLGLWGRLYWYCLLPVHHFIFGGMLRNIAKSAKRQGCKTD
jgi:uncharacterized protein YbjT (DUF2867 family)